MDSANNSRTDREKERTAAEKRLNEYLTEERERKRKLDEKLCRELRARHRDEERITADTRLNEYLAEERERKKLLEDKLTMELAGRPGPGRK